MVAQLITGDSEQVNFGSGLVILPEMDQAIVRHMANKINYIYTAFPTNISTSYNERYIMKLMVHNGVVKAFVNGIRIYVSGDADRSIDLGSLNRSIRSTKQICDS